MPDGIDAVEQGLDQIARVILGVIRQLYELGEMSKSFGRQSARLNQNPFEVNLRNKQLRVAENFATELKKSSPRIDELALELRESCTVIEVGFEDYSSVRDIVDATELERIQNVIRILQDSKDDLIGTTEELENIRDMTSSFRMFLLESVGEIKRIDVPLRHSATSLGNLVNELRHFDTVSTSIIGRLS